MLRLNSEPGSLPEEALVLSSVNTTLGFIRKVYLEKIYIFFRNVFRKGNTFPSLWRTVPSTQSMLHNYLSRIEEHSWKEGMRGLTPGRQRALN